MKGWLGMVVEVWRVGKWRGADISVFLEYVENLQGRG